MVLIANILDSTRQINLGAIEIVRRQHDPVGAFEIISFHSATVLHSGLTDWQAQHGQAETWITL